MTRGTAYIILPDGTIKTSCEFNGDMYGSPQDGKELQENGHYSEMVTRLKKVHDGERFEREIRAFDRDNHNYQAETNDYFRFYIWKLEEEMNKGGVIDVGVDYYGRFFSDYLFWKNVSGKTITFRDKETRKKIPVPHGKIATFYFGKHIEIV